MLADRREQLLPRAPRITPAELVAEGERYARATGYPIQFQWTLIDGINDGEAEVDGLVRLYAGKYAIVNLIPYNAVEGLAFRRPPAARAEAMAAALRRQRAPLLPESGPCRPTALPASTAAGPPPRSGRPPATEFRARPAERCRQGPPLASLPGAPPPAPAHRAVDRAPAPGTFLREPTP